jgi:GAF domain-containing protein
VAERTAKMERRNLDLALATEIGQTVSQVRAINDMLKDAAEIIRTFFGLYYVQVYLSNESQTELVLQFGTGEVGAELMQRGHRLPLNEDSINGRAAVTKRSVVIANTANSAFFRPNPLLPNTHSEVAVPLLVGDTLVGVLDVQSEDADLLTEDALLAFEPMAGQMAVAIQNARLIAETQQARAEVESLARRLTHAGWEDYLDAIHKPESSGFVFEQDNVTPLTGQEKSPAENALVASIEVTGEKLGSLVVEFERASSISQTDELINTVARQVSQHIESLRLLDSAERFRYEAEQASRRLTHEGWQEFMEDSATKGAGYVYDLREVRSSAPDETEKAEMAGVSLPLKIRDEAIGKVILHGVDANDIESVEIANVVAERLSAHIEGLRLALQTEKALSTTKKQAQREQALRQITSAVRGSTDPATILRTAARELGAIMGRQTVVQLETATHEVHNNQAHVSADLMPDSAMTNENRYVPSVESSNGDDGGNK